MHANVRLSLWGGPECTVNRVGDVFRDQLRLTGHHDRLEDLERIAGLGVTALRYPVLWERTAPDHPEQRDFSWADERLAELRRLGIRPIVGLIHHGSGPRYTSLLDPGFATGLAAHAAAVVERYPWVADWTPVNEPLTTARFSCLYGYWYPHTRDEGACWTALLNQIDAVRLSMRAIRRVNPAARLVQTDDLGGIHATLEMAGQAAFERERRWLSWDLLAGTVTPAHPLWARLASHGLADRLRAIADDPCPADVIGINHYVCSSRFLTHETVRHPHIQVAADGAPCINLEAVRTVPEAGFEVGRLLAEAWARYGTTLAITECHNGCTREEQARWFHDVWRAAEAARASGIGIEAVTAWSLFGAVDWNSLLTRDAGHYENGVFDARAEPPLTTLVSTLLRALAGGAAPPRPDLLARPGWWRRPERFLPGYGPAHGGRAVLQGAPILITGATGTLARALGRACERRGLAHVLSERRLLALDDPASMARALDEHAPWAVINCAGIVSIDHAEADPALCERVNAAGAEALARAAGVRGIAFVQLSSDQVFDGAGGAPYDEDAPVNPLNAYGRAKANAETRVRAVHGAALIIRTAAFFSPDDPHNFAVHAVDTMRDGRRFAAASDQLVSPTFVPDLVDALLDLLVDGATGTWHLANPGGMSWADFARALAAATELDLRLVDGVPGAALGQPAPRPADVRLASRAALLPPLDQAIARFAERYPAPAALALAAE